MQVLIGPQAPKWTPKLRYDFTALSVFLPLGLPLCLLLLGVRVRCNFLAKYWGPFLGPGGREGPAKNLTL